MIELHMFSYNLVTRNELYTVLKVSNEASIQ